MTKMKRMLALCLTVLGLFALTPGGFAAEETAPTMLTEAEYLKILDAPDIEEGWPCTFTGRISANSTLLTVGEWEALVLLDGDEAYPVYCRGNLMKDIAKDSEVIITGTVMGLNSIASYDGVAVVRLPYVIVTEIEIVK